MHCVDQLVQSPLNESNQHFERQYPYHTRRLFSPVPSARRLYEEQHNIQTADPPQNTPHPSQSFIWSIRPPPSDLCVVEFNVSQKIMLSCLKPPESKPKVTVTKKKSPRCLCTDWKIL